MKSLISALISISFAFFASLAIAEAPANYQTSCFACHVNGVAGAPKTGDKEAWAKRLEGGMDAMVASVKAGKGAMPPMGLCPKCSDDDFKALIQYMAK